jgi:hypothetical protein
MVRNAIAHFLSFYPPRLQTRSWMFFFKKNEQSEVRDAIILQIAGFALLTVVKAIN